MDLIRSIALAAAVFAPLQAGAGWEIVPEKTVVTFEVGYLGVTSMLAVFRKVEPRLVFDAQNIEASSVAITIGTASAETGIAARDTVLRGPDWLDAKSHPTILFVSKAVRRVDDRNLVIAGDLTVRGITLPVEFATTLGSSATDLPPDGALDFVATTRVKRFDFGMMRYRALVAESVVLQVRLELVQKP